MNHLYGDKVKQKYLNEHYKSFNFFNNSPKKYDFYFLEVSEHHDTAPQQQGDEGRCGSHGSAIRCGRWGACATRIGLGRRAIPTAACPRVHTCQRGSIG